MESLFSVIMIIAYVLAVGIIASSRDRNVIIWPIICIIFPVVGLLVLALMPNFGRVKCPKCGNVFTINDNEVRGKHHISLAKRG